MKKIYLNGRVKRGLRIASGLNPDPMLRLNNTIALQKPYFIKAGVLGIEAVYNGTVNIYIGPSKFKILKPDYEITCEWVPGVTETFWLVRADISFGGKTHNGYVYYPCPSAVKSHDDNVVELLTEKILNLNYGDPISAIVDDDKIALI